MQFPNRIKEHQHLEVLSYFRVFIKKKNSNAIDHSNSFEFSFYESTHNRVRTHLDASALLFLYLIAPYPKITKLLLV